MKLFILSLLTLTGSAVFSQTIKGRVNDQQQAPAAAATMSLLHAKDSSIIKLEVSKTDGTYEFKAVQPGKYLVKATLAGHTPACSEVLTMDSSDIAAANLTVKKIVAEMQGVTVTAVKPLVEIKADKTIINVEGTINATGSDMIELLRKSPGVMVDKDDNLSMAGKTGVQVYIDGRPSPLSGEDLARYLRTIQSSQVESIQLITNPSAKYEAAGNAGIINIVLKKNKALGTNGSVAAGWNIGTFPKYNGSFALNHRSAKLNIFGNLGVNRSKNITTMNTYRTIPDSTFDQKGNLGIRMTSYNVKMGADYFVNKQTTIGTIITGNFADMGLVTKNSTPIAGKETGEISRILVAGGDNQRKNDNINTNLNFTHNGTKNGKSLSLNADYGYYNIKSHQIQPNEYYDPAGQTLLSRTAITIITPAKIDIYSFKADYEQNIGKGKLEAGGKTGYVQTNNDFQQYDNNLVKDLDRSNRFRYKENINAAYANYSRAFKGFMIQAGLRAENTNIEGISSAFKNEGNSHIPYDSSFKRHYTDLFPSASVTFNKNPASQLSLTYSRRIDRPSYQQLNQFELRLSEYYSMRGNVNLRPQYTNSFGITHTYKYKLTTSLNYSIVKDMFTQVTDTTEISKSFVTLRNLASQKVLNLNVSYMLRKGNYMSVINASTNYSSYKANIDKRPISRDAFGFGAFMQNSLSFAKTFTAELSGFYYAPTLMMGLMKTKGMWSTDAGIQKKVWNGKATIKASVSDIFHSLRYRATTDFSGQRTTNDIRFESRMFKLNFTYRFGRTTVKAARQRSTGADEENKRAAQSGGSTGTGF